VREIVVWVWALLIIKLEKVCIAVTEIRRHFYQIFFELFEHN
jgi:hypothetical protein